MRTFEGLCLAALLSLASCDSRTIEYRVNVVSAGCEAAVDPFEGVNWVEIRVRGAGIDPPLSVGAARSTGNLQLPQIPAGPARLIEVRGYSDQGGTLLSIGRSRPFDVPDVVPTDPALPPVNVFLRKVNSFSRPSSATNPLDCAQMRSARAGHAAVALSDGRVLITGGYQLSPGALPRTALDSAELFDPGAGVFTDAKRMGLETGSGYAKAFHTATFYDTRNGGQVLLWGGENYPTATAITPSAAVLIYDVGQNAYGLVKKRDPPLPPNIGRTRHLAAIDANGKILIAGGFSRPDTTLAPVSAVEWYDPLTGRASVLDGVALPRIDGSALAVQDGAVIAVAGGHNGTQMQDEVAFFKYSGTTFEKQALTKLVRLPGARRSAGAGLLAGSDDLLLVGGYSDVATVAPLATSDLVRTRAGEVSGGPPVGSRGDICAVTLADGSILAVGGRTVDALGMPPRSDGSAVRIVANPSGGPTAVAAPPLPKGRYQHTCTLMKDGSVLVLGGVEEIAGVPTVLQDAWIFTPAPVD